MIQKIIILSISIYLFGCATGTVVNPCGSGYVLHNNLCWTKKFVLTIYASHSTFVL